MSKSLKEIDILGSYEVIFIAEIEGEDIYTKNITINFNADAKVNGDNSCNNYGGNYKVDDSKLSFSMMMATRKYCQETAEIETTFMRNLNEVDGFKLNKEVLILLRGNTRVIEARRVLKKDN